jgi:hypothetical protein
LSVSGIATDFSGCVIDEMCSTKPSMKGREPCARKCIKSGSPAVLLTSEAKVYELDDQAKAVKHTVRKLLVTGTLGGDTIKIETIKVDSGCIPGPTGCK